MIQPSAWHIYRPRPVVATMLVFAGVFLWLAPIGGAVVLFGALCTWRRDVHDIKKGSAI